MVKTHPREPVTVRLGTSQPMVQCVRFLRVLRFHCKHFVSICFVLMGKYDKFDVSYQGRRFNWPFWLIPIFAAFLILVIGLFIFVTLDSNRRFGCLLGGCEDREVSSAQESGKPTPTLRSELKAQQDSSQAKKMIDITGKILFPADKTPESLPSNSHLNVKFEDVSLQDAGSTVLASAEVDLTGYKKGKQLEYALRCEKPSTHGMYSVSAVLNVGWSPSGDDWIHKNDFLCDTTHSVDITDDKNEYTKDIDLVKY